MRGISYETYLRESRAAWSEKQKALIGDVSGEEEPIPDEGRKPQSEGTPSFAKAHGLKTNEKGQILLPNTPETTEKMKKFKESVDAEALEFLQEHAPEAVEQYKSADPAKQKAIRDMIEDTQYEDMDIA